jgi:hypothetical protein
MELQECSHQAGNYHVKYERDHYHDIIAQFWIVTREKLIIKTPKYGLIKIPSHDDHSAVSDKQHIAEEQDEILPVPEANAIIDPGAVMIHVKHTSIACGAVMASLGLEDVAHEAVSSPLVLVVTQMESPEDWNLSWVSCHGLEKRPDKHHEENIVNN